MNSPVFLAGVPRLRAPPGACDCHMHIFDARFPLAGKARRTEPDALVPAYRVLQQRLGLQRVVVVQPTAYGRDNRCTLEAIAELGAGAGKTCARTPGVGEQLAASAGSRGRHAR